MITTGSIKLLGEPSSDVNTLDYYEEGIWTPAITASTPGTLSVTYYNRSGVYTRIGRVVSVHGSIEITSVSIGTASGNIIISGLPYTPAAGPSAWGSCYTSGIDIGGSMTLCCVNSSFGKAFQLRTVVNNAGSVSVAISSIAAGDNLQFSFCYNAE